MKLYNKQIDGGRYFLHEHPFTATSWKEKSVTDTMKREGVINKKRSYICKFGMYQESENVVEFGKKPTALMTNAPEIAEELKGKCTGAHTHTHLINGRAKRAEVYPDEVRYKILTGLIKHMRRDGKLQEGCIGAIWDLKMNLK